VSIVSVFASKRGLVVGMQKFENKKESEIGIVQELIAALDLTDVVFTFDSLHCQKKLVS
jgi:predicted transposase YbfD/YdcC